mmetsp:Transcript_152/g.217  ORF Transcript_152/g.217 Transcript_152/m.217 type:complete len:177 (-) Transcript_152:88-618(-)
MTTPVAGRTPAPSDGGQALELLELAAYSILVARQCFPDAAFTKVRRCKHFAWVPRMEDVQSYVTTGLSTAAKAGGCHFLLSTRTASGVSEEFLLVLGPVDQTVQPITPEDAAAKFLIELECRLALLPAPEGGGTDWVLASDVSGGAEWSASTLAIGEGRRLAGAAVGGTGVQVFLM